MATFLLLLLAAAKPSTSAAASHVAANGFDLEPDSDDDERLSECQADEVGPEEGGAFRALLLEKDLGTSLASA
eukprot:3804799-Pleurochrysis_carterae.AAC.1